MLHQAADGCICCEILLLVGLLLIESAGLNVTHS